MKEGKQAAEQQAMMEQQQAMAMAQGGGIDPATGMPMEGAPPGEEGMMPGEEGMMPGEEGMMPGEMPGEEAGSELDQHIGELEAMVSKGQKPSVMDLRKTVESLLHLRKSQKLELVKQTKDNTSGQKKLVDNILKKWEKDANKASDSIEDIIKQSGVKLED